MQILIQTKAKPTANHLIARGFSPESRATRFAQPAVKATSANFNLSSLNVLPISTDVQSENVTNAFNNEHKQQEVDAGDKKASYMLNRQAVQMKAAGAVTPQISHKIFQLQQHNRDNNANSAMHQIAASGVQGTGGKLPYYDKIQKSFGRHDISNVQAYTNSSARIANQAISAEAYATDNKIAFASPNPSLHTVAHESAHIVQQQSGIQLKEDVGEVGDQHEQHADAVADKVVQGGSAESLLNKYVDKKGKQYFTAIGKTQTKLMNVQRRPNLLQRVKRAKNRKVQRSVFDWIGDKFNAIKGYVKEKTIMLAAKIVGIPPEKLLTTLNNFGGVLKNIMKNPGNFLKNIANAVKSGFNKFSENFKKHLRNSVMGWLFGKLGGKITIPRPFVPPFHLFDIARQSLGLTIKYIKDRAIKKLGKRAPQVETIVEHVTPIFIKGPRAIWQEFRNKMGNIKRTVTNGIKKILIEALIKAGIKKIAVLAAGPAGAIVEGIVAIYKTVALFIDKAKEFAAIGKGIMGSMANIARGKIEPAAKHIENVLKGSMILAIQWLAKIAGLGRIDYKVKKIIKKLRYPINRAVDTIINKVGGLVGKGKTFAKKVKDKVVAWWDMKKPIKIDNENHVLRFEGVGKRAVLGINPRFVPLDGWVKKRRDKYKDDQESLKIIGIIEKILIEIDNTVHGAMRKSKKNKIISAKYKQIFTEMQKLQNPITDNPVYRLKIKLDVETEPTKISDNNGEINKINEGRKMLSYPITVEHWGTGTGTGKNPEVRKVADTARKVFKRRKGSVNDRDFVAGHLLNTKLGGISNQKNITAFSRYDNESQHQVKIETEAKNAVKEGKIILYEVEIDKRDSKTYRDKPKEPTGDAVSNLASHMIAEFKVLRKKGDPFNPNDYVKRGGKYTSFPLTKIRSRSKNLTKGKPL